PHGADDLRRVAHAYLGARRGPRGVGRGRRPALEQRPRGRVDRRRIYLVPVVEFERECGVDALEIGEIHQMRRIITRLRARRSGLKAQGLGLRSARPDADYLPALSLEP